MLSKREKEKKFGGQSQHFIYYYYPSTKKTHFPPSSPFKSGQGSPLLSSPLLAAAIVSPFFSLAGLGRSLMTSNSFLHSFRTDACKLDLL